MNKLAFFIGLFFFAVEAFSQQVPNPVPYTNINGVISWSSTLSLANPNAFNYNPLITGSISANEQNILTARWANTGGSTASDMQDLLSQGRIASTNTGAWTGQVGGINGSGVIESGATGSLTTLFGGYFGNQNLSSGFTVTNSIGLLGANFGSNPVTNGVGVSAYSNGATNNTDLLLGTQTPVVGNYSIYDANTSPSVFSGPIKFPTGSTVNGYVTPVSNLIGETQLPHIKSCIAKVNNPINGGDCNWLLIGDSTYFGAFSNGTASGDYHAQNFPTQFAKILNAEGIPAEANSLIGMGPGTQFANDNRFTVGSSWTASSVFTIGGEAATSTTTTNALTFTPAASVDTFRVFYPFAPTGTRTFNISIDGGSTTSVNSTSATLGFGTQTLTTTLGGSHFMSAQETAGMVYVSGFDAWDSSRHWIHLLNAGWRSATAANWDDTSHTYSAITAIQNLAPDACFIDLTINDAHTGTALATYSAQIQAIINTCAVSGDVVLMTGTPSQITYTPLATQQQYVNAFISLGIANNDPIEDVFSRWKTWEIQNALSAGMVYTDGIHPEYNGYLDMAVALGKFIGQIGPGETNTNNFTNVSPSIGGSALLAGACSSNTVIVNGASVGMGVTATPITYPGDGNYWFGYVSSANTITIKVCAAIAGTPTASVYRAVVIQ